MPAAADVSLSLIQLRDEAGDRRVGIVHSPGKVVLLAGEATTYLLAREAIDRGVGLAEVVRERATAEEMGWRDLVERATVLPPLD
ncbi:MAG TPA: hypothetical protein VFZ18_09045, partial [Longimicrobiaceae bacterium]